MFSLDAGSYFIHAGLEGLPGFLRKQGYIKVFVLCDSNTREVCFPLLAPHLPAHDMIWVPAGEDTKRFTELEELLAKLSFRSAGRQHVLINLGGGMVTDLGGFAASIYHRGIPFINIPTTLLAMLDATIGGKTGINLRGTKNLAGTFTNPAAVYIHADFLKTLPEREFRAGYAEAIKHALIADPAYWADLTADDYPPSDVIGLIRRSLEIKLRFVKEDPFEKGIRKALNFGHTLGHALEGLALTQHSSLLHGEAVAAGMVMEAWLSWQLLGFPQEDYLFIRRYILHHYGKITISENDRELLPVHIIADKKNIGTALRFALLTGIGQCKVDVPIDLEMVDKAVEAYISL